MRLTLEDDEYHNFRLSGLYLAINLVLLLLFAVYALNTANFGNAAVLFSFATAIVLVYGVIWLSGRYWLARHFTTGVMALLCFYLFITGGLQNTGPLYYFLFPSVALFLHGRLNGVIWVIALLMVTIALWRQWLPIETVDYDNVFVARVIALNVVITLLACIPEYFRRQAQRNLLLTISDIEAMSFGDPRTDLANRPLLEKMLQLEFNRHERYGTACCVMLIELDPLPASVPRPAQPELRRWLAGILRENLRIMDVTGLWEGYCFLLILPEIDLEGARSLAGRLLGQVRSARLPSLGVLDTPTASIGIAVLDGKSSEEVLARASRALMSARVRGGNACAVHPVGQAQA